MPPLQSSVLFEGEDDRGIDIVVNLHIKFELSGVYWIYLSLNNVRLTKIPLRLIYMPQIMTIPGTSGGLPPSPGPSSRD